MNATYSQDSQLVDVRVSVFDRFNAALIALIMLVAVLVTILFLIWWTTKFDFSRSGTLVFPVPDLGEEFEQAESELNEILEPGVQEFPVATTAELMDSLEVVTDAVSTVAGNLEQQDGHALQSGFGGGGGGRDPHPGPDETDLIPEHKRWKIEYESETIEQYARQLDHFQILLGAFSLDTNEIALVRNLSQGGEVETSNRKQESKTLRFEHEIPRMRRWDRRLIRLAGVDLTGRLSVQFYPEETRVVLREVEAQYLRKISRELKEVRRTVFKVEPIGTGFEFKVREMQFRSGLPADR